VYRNYQTGLSEVYIQKVKFKHWGQTGCVHFAWDKFNGRYYKGQPDYETWMKVELGEQKELPQNNDFLNDIITNNQINGLPF